MVVSGQTNLLDKSLADQILVRREVETPKYDG